MLDLDFEVLDCGIFKRQESSAKAAGGSTASLSPETSLKQEREFESIGSLQTLNGVAVVSN